MLGRDRAFPLAIRGLALVTAVAVLIRMATAGGGWDLPQVVRAIEMGVAVIVAWFAAPGRSQRELNGLTLALLLGITLTNAVLMVLVGGTMWKMATIIVAVIFFAVVFAAWSWWYQAALAGALTIGTVAAIAMYGDPAERAGGDLIAVGLTLGGVAIASVLGAYLAELARGRLVASEQRYRSLFDFAHDAVAVLDAGGRVVEVNERMARLLKRPGVELVGTSAVEALAPIQPGGRPRPEAFEQSFARVRQGGLVVVPGNLLDAAGTEIEVELSLSQCRTPEGPVVLVLARDLTERRQLERRRERERRIEAIARLAGGVAHRFNNLLAAVLANASFLGRETRKPDEAKALREIADAAREGAKLSRELMLFGRYERTQLRPVRPEIVLSRVVALAQAALLSDVRVEVDVAEGLPDLAGDPDQLVHAGVQLALNARNAMPYGGTLTFGARAERVASGDRAWPGAAAGDFVCLTVQDSGVGMDPDTIDHLFEPFFTTRPAYEGGGVGLPAVYGIVRAHHGTVRIDSEPEKGTAVHVLIPVWRDEPPAGKVVRAARPTREATILVVDDEEVVRSSVRRVLTRAGYSVCEADDAESAVTVFGAAEPRVDAVILDMILPGGGARIFRELRRERPDLPIIVSSGYVGEDDSELRVLQQEGAAAVLPKPYELDELLRAVAAAVGDAD